MKSKILTGALAAFLSFGYGLKAAPIQVEQNQVQDTEFSTAQKNSGSNNLGKTLLITVALFAAVYGLDYALQFAQEIGIPKVYEYGIFVSKVNELSIYFIATMAPLSAKMLKDITEQTKKIPDIFRSTLTGILAKNILVNAYGFAINNTATKKIKSLCEYGINKIINLVYNLA